MKTTKVILVGLIGCWLTLAAGGVRAQNATNTHVLVIFSDRQAVEAFVNGFPLHSAAGTNAKTDRVVASAYLFRGSNEFRLMTTDALTNVLAHKATAELLRLNHFSLGAPEGTNLLELERTVTPLGTNGLEETITFTNGPTFDVRLSANLTAARTVASVDADSQVATVRTLAGAGTNTLTLSVTLTNPLLTSLPWLSPPVTIEAQDLADIRQVLAEVHAAFTNRSPGALTNLLRLKIERTAIAKGLTFEEEASIRLVFFQRLFEQPGLVTAPMDLNDLAIRNYRPANLVQAFVGGQHPVTLNGQDFRYRLPLFLSRVGGAWRIVD